MRFLPEGKIRVVELAQTLGVNSATLMKLLGDLGVSVPNQMALVDASLEARLKGLIRRPSTGGRGMAAARPEPTWLTSLHWPRPPKPAEEEPEPSPEPAPAGARTLVGARSEGRPEEAGAGPAAAGRTTVAEARDGKPAGAAAKVLPSEKAPGPTLPSGRTPVPPPPPLPLRRGERVAAPGRSPAAAAGEAPAAKTGPAGVTVPKAGASGAPAAKPGPAGGPGPSPAAAGAKAGPGGPSAARPPAAGAGPRPATGPEAAPLRRVRPGAGERPVRPAAGERPASPAGRRPYGPEVRAVPGARPGPAPGGYPSRAPVPGRPYGGGYPAGRTGGPRPAGVGYGERGAGGREFAPRGGVPAPGWPAPGRGFGPGPQPGVGKGAGDRRRDRRGAGGVPSRGKGRGAPVEREGWEAEDEAERRVARSRHGGRRLGAPAARAPERPRVRATEVVIDGPLTVRELAERMGITGAELIKSLIRLGIVASLNQVLDPESARIAVAEMGVKVLLAQPAKEAGGGAANEESLREGREDEENLQPRAPVVTVMGHVDHGKTSLLDAIRRTNVTAGEAGGITQHIGASTVDWQGKRIIFLDTPGHEAFTAMRARGAKVTDIAVLVVAADDGVMPQTLEAINHARAAKVPIIVALNKIDKPNALPDRVKKQLSENGLTPEDWGGDTIVVPVSAKERTGIDDLLDMIILVAEMAELKANPDRRARGVVIETRLDKGLGPVASVLIQTGTLRVGDPVLAGTAFGRVRAMVDDRGNRLEEAGPSTPVEVTGLDELPAAGDSFLVLADEKMAREIAANREERARAREIGGVRAAPSLDDLFREIREGARKQLNLVLKADVQGSLEALKQSFEKLEEPEVGVGIIHSGVGGVTESDVMLAAASDAIVIAFNVTPDAGAREAAEQRHVDIRTYRVIYDAINDVKAAIKGLRAPVFKEVVLGHAEVRELFRIPKVGIIAGCYVTDGKIARKSQVRVVRDGVIVHEGPLASLKHHKEDVREIAAGFECGVGIEGFQDIKEGDVLEAFVMEEVAR